MFIDPSPFGEAFDATDIETGEVLKYPAGHPKAGKSLFKRRFIPARLSDNPYLSESGDYEAMLLSLPEHQRKQLLEGDWDIKEGRCLLSLIARYTLLNPFRFLVIGLNFVLVTMVMGLIQVCFGSLYRQMNSWLFTGSFTYLRY